MTDIGAMLREARMREHLDIAEFESRTKIRAKYLRALEDEEWALLPGYTFTKAFLRTYADMLGLDGRMLVDEFKRQYQDPSEIDLAPVPPARRDARRGRERARERPGERGRERSRRRSGPSSRVMLVAVLVLALAAALYAVKVLSQGNGHKPAKTHTTSTHSHTTSTRTHTVAPARVALKLVPTTAVHVCLIGYRTTRSRGLQRINGELTPSSPARIYHADSRFRVSFTGGAIRMIINGRSVPVAASATPVSYEIFVGGRHVVLPASRAPHCS
jgi:cytoskeleton protein RodZ